MSQLSDQKSVFLDSEGNAWYQRNKAYYQGLPDHKDDVLDFLLEQNIEPKKVLEIGCADGRRLDLVRQKFNCECSGVDVAKDAIEAGSEKYPELNLVYASADDLPFEPTEFDLIIIGFCLYLCDREDLFTIANSVDNLLAEKGFLVIKDFQPTYPYKRKYGHKEGLFSYKMDYSQMFLWNPSYSKLAVQVTSHSGHQDRLTVDERYSYQLLYKDTEQAYPEF